MPRNNFIRLRGVVSSRPYVDMVPNRQTGEKVAFFRVHLDCPRDESQPRDEKHGLDRIRVVAYGRLAESLRGRVKPGDWLVVTGWVQIREREGVEAQAISRTLAEVIAMEVDHFMRPFIPGGDVMVRMEQQAARRGVSVRDLLTRVVVGGLLQLEQEGEVLVSAETHPGGNGEHG